MSKKQSRPAWFKMFLHQKALIDSVPDNTAGKALKAVFHYFDTGEILELDPLSSVVFAAIKPYIDESFGDFQRSSEAGKAGNAKRWGKGVSGGNTPCKPPTDPIAPNPEAEAEAEAETEAETERESTAPPAASPAPASDCSGKSFRKKYGQYGWIKLTDEEYTRLSNDLGQAEVERCISYIDESAQSTGNKNKWRDWNLVIRRCHRDGWGLGKAAGKSDTRERVKTAADYDDE